MENINKPIDIMLSTVDNPYNPFSHWDEWYQYDIEHGYDTCGLLARLMPDTSKLTEREEELAIDSTIDSIVNDFPLNIYIKVSKDSVVHPISLEQFQTFTESKSNS